MRSSRARFRRVGLGWIAVASVAGLPRAADATTVATFEWISTGSVGGTVTPTGTLVLSLPDTITTPTFDTGIIGAAAAAPMLTAFSYTFGDETSIDLTDITPSTIAPLSWYTSSTNISAGAPGGSVYLLSGFTFSGLAGTPLNFFQIANSAGTQNGEAGPSQVGASSNNLYTVDSGYWRLSSFATAAVVPLPAALPLLFAGLVAYGGLARRRRSAA
jgi:hypothetical protein